MISIIQMHDPIEYPDEWGFIEAAPKIDKVSPKLIIFEQFDIFEVRLRPSEYGIWKVIGHYGQCVLFKLMPGRVLSMTQFDFVKPFYKNLVHHKFFR